MRMRGFDRCKRSEHNLYQRLEKEAIRQFCKSELYSRAILLDTEEVTFEVDLGMNNYKYGLEKLVYTCRQEILESGGQSTKKVKYIPVEVHIYCDIGFIRYCDLYQLAHDVKYPVEIHIISFKKLSDMRPSELYLLSAVKNLYIEGKCDTNKTLRNCRIAFIKDLDTAVNSFVSFFDKLTQANVRYEGEIEFNIEVDMHEEEITKETILKVYDVLRGLLDYTHKNLNLSKLKVSFVNAGNKVFYMQSREREYNLFLDVLKLLAKNDKELLRVVKTPVYCLSSIPEDFNWKKGYELLKFYTEETNIHFEVFAGSIGIPEYTISVYGIMEKMRSEPDINPESKIELY